MKLTTLSRLAIKQAKNRIAENIYLKKKYLVVKPINFYGIINERCNCKCRQCDYWRREKYVPEMTIEEWKKALVSIKEFIGEFSINFSGGEPFIKKDFLDILAFGNQNGIHCGVTTNGSCFTRQTVARTVAAHPFNVNISVDAPEAELHDYLRVMPGLFDKISAGIGYLREESLKQNVHFPIIVKPTVNRLNFRLLPKMVDWAHDIGATTVNFQPVDNWTREARETLWIEEKDHAELSRIIERLIEMKKKGSPIMNSDEVLRMILPHFRNEKASVEYLPCRVGLRNFFIETDGNIRICNDFQAIGNIKDQSARDIWMGKQAEKIRQQTLACRRLCLSTCVSQKKFKDKITMGLKLLKN